METVRERNLKAGMPYIRQVVTWKGKLCTVMVYDFCTETNVQLAQGVQTSAILWNTVKHTWIPYKECLLNPVDREFVIQFTNRAVAAQEGFQPARKPMPPPTRVHKTRKKISRQKAKAMVRKGEQP